MADAETSASPARRTDLSQRVATAVILGAVAGFALWRGGWVLDLLVLIVGVLAFWEWQRLARRWKGASAAALAWVGVGALYIGAATGLMVAMEPALVMLVIILVALTDSGAYFAGRMIGGPRIAPRISPSKTWAGLVGGMVSAGLGAALLTAMVTDAHGHHPGNFGDILLSADAALAALAGAVLAVTAQAGDFFESWLKRKAGVKDSSRWLPGHGGILDRVDGMLPAAILVGLGAAVTGVA